MLVATSVSLGSGPITIRFSEMLSYCMNIWLSEATYLAISRSKERTFRVRSGSSNLGRSLTITGRIGG